MALAASAVFASSAAETMAWAGTASGTAGAVAAGAAGFAAGTGPAWDVAAGWVPDTFATGAVSGVIAGFCLLRKTIAQAPPPHRATKRMMDLFMALMREGSGIFLFAPPAVLCHEARLDGQGNNPSQHQQETVIGQRLGAAEKEGFPEKFPANFSVCLQRVGDGAIRKITRKDDAAHRRVHGGAAAAKDLPAEGETAVRPHA